MKQKLTVTLFLLLLTVAGFAQKPQRPEGAKTKLALKTNLLGCPLSLLNAGMELGFATHASLVAHAYVPRWHTTGDPSWCIDANLLDTELRYWFHSKEKPVLSGHFLGVCGMLGKVDLADKRKGNQADVRSCGLTYGYSVPSRQHFRFEFSLTLGYLEADFTRYKLLDGASVPTSTTSGTTHWFGPTKGEISFIYVLGK